MMMLWNSTLSLGKKITLALNNFRSDLRREGFRKTSKRYGWRLFAVVFVYYLIRDSFLYLLLPFLFARQLF